MKQADFINAVTIISQHHTTQMLINKPLNGHVGKLGESEYTIHINDCCASVINKLKDGGFTLSMDKFGLNVNKF